MKLGVCASPDQLATVYAQGYDYIECNFGWLTTMSDADYEANTALVEKSPIKAEAFNCFFTGSFPLYAADGDQTDILPQVAEYCEKGFARAAAWGGKVAVIGSGGARRIPDGMTREQVDNYKGLHNDILKHSMKSLLPFLCQPSDSIGVFCHNKYVLHN